MNKDAYISQSPVGSDQMQFPTSMVAFIKGAIIVFSLSVIILFISYVITHPNLAESISNQYATFYGQRFSFNGQQRFVLPFYNRILFPFLLVSFRDILPRVSDIHLFLLLRFLSFVLCLSAIYLAASRRCNQERNGVLVTCFGLSISMMPTFNHPWVQPSDIFDVTFSFFMFLYIAEEKLVAAFLIACLTAINRESGPFAAIFYICIAYGIQKPYLLAMRAFALGLMPYLGALLVRKLVLGHQLSLLSTGQHYVLALNFQSLKEALGNPSPTGWPVLLFVMMAIPWAVFINLKPAEISITRVAVAFIAIFCITLEFGIIEEVRVFIPCVALLFACAIANVPLSGIEVKRRWAA